MKKRLMTVLSMAFALALVMFTYTSVQACSDIDCEKDSDLIAMYELGYEIEVTIVNVASMREIASFMFNPALTLDAQILAHSFTPAVSRPIFVQPFVSTASIFNNTCSHAWFATVVGSSSTEFSSHDVFVRVTYTNIITGATSIRYDHRTCTITAWTEYWELQCMNCGVSNSSTTISISHSLC